MKLFLYVYIPGFEYDSKGPLHIDAIRLDATVGEISINEDGLIQNSLNTYIYIDSLDSNTGKANNYLEGNLVYRSVKTDSNRFKTKYKGEEYLSPCYTENPEVNKRALNGFFYDFITSDLSSEITHHVIGIHNTIAECKNIENFLIEHDGLFIIELNELNTDLYLNFTFYSRIDFLNDKIGITENITNQDNAWFFNLKERELSQNKFFDKYIEIGKWSTTYNPAISGNEQNILNIETENPVPQYFDLKLWGDSTIKLWQIPINADILVSNSNGNQLKYDFDSNSENFRTHQNNSKTIRESYNDFYKDNSREFFALSTLTGNQEPICNFARARDDGNKGWDGRQYFSKYIYTSKTSMENEINYKLSYVDLSNFDYLYNTKPNILIKNDTSSDNLAFVTIDTIGTEVIDHTGDKGFIKQLVHDFYNFSLEENHEWGKDNYVYVYDNINALKRKTILTDGASININFSEQLPGEVELVIKLSDNLIIPNYFNISTGSISDITNNIYLKEKLTTAYNKRQRKKTSTKESGLWNDNYSFYGLYAGIINNNLELSDYSFFTSDTILNKEKRVFMVLSDSNNIKLKMGVSNILFPIALCEFNNSVGDRHTESMKQEMKNLNHNQGWGNKEIITDVDGDYFPDAWNYKEDGTKRKLSGDGKSYLAPMKYDHYQYMLDFGFGNINFCFSQTFYIDLNSSNIEYSNFSDHSVIPMLKYSASGYMTGDTGDKLTNITVDITKNLLEPEDSTEEFELQKICNLTDSPFKFLIMKNVFFDSTFCNDSRFIGTTDGNDISVTFKNNANEILIPANSAVVLKIQTLLPNTDRLTLHYKLTKSGVTLEYSTTGNDGVFLFYASEESILLTLKEIKLIAYSNKYELYDLISGIGAYNIPVTDTNVLIKMLYNCLKNSEISGFVPVDTTGDPYHYIIFPAAFCARENIEFCKRRSDSSYTSTNYSRSYKNDYCISKETDPIYHYYNLYYLPEKAIYEVHGYYTIPSSNKKIPSDVILRDRGRTADKLNVIKNQIVKL